MLMYEQKFVIPLLYYILEHNPGLVPLQVSCDGQVVSNTVIFEYKEKQRTGISLSSDIEQVKDWFSVSGKLTGTMLWAISADKKLMIFF